MLRVRRRCAQTAHISLQIPYISKSEDTKQSADPNFGPICRRVSSYSVRPSQAASRSVPLHHCVVSSSVRRYLGSLNKTRKHKMHLPSHYFHISELTYNIWGLVEFSPQSSGVLRNILTRSAVLSGRFDDSLAVLDPPCRQQGQNRGHIEC
jgi:hypothetical protein